MLFKKQSNLFQNNQNAWNADTLDWIYGLQALKRKEKL